MDKDSHLIFESLGSRYLVIVIDDNRPKRYVTDVYLKNISNKNIDSNFYSHQPGIYSIHIDSLKFCIDYSMHFELCDDFIDVYSRAKDNWTDRDNNKILDMIDAAIVD